MLTVGWRFGNVASMKSNVSWTPIIGLGEPRVVDLRSVPVRADAPAVDEKRKPVGCQDARHPIGLFRNSPATLRISLNRDRVAKVPVRLKAADWCRRLPGFNRNGGVRERPTCFLIDDLARQSASNGRTYKHWTARNAFD